MKIPVLLLVYNRPKETQNILRHLENLNVKNLFITLDGPKNNKKDKEELSKKIEILTNKFIEGNENLMDEIKVLSKSLSEQSNKIKKLQISGIILILITFTIISYLILKF